MARCIFKYPWPNSTKMGPDAIAFIMMPEGGKILCLKMQDEWPQIWALVETTARLIHRQFTLVGTGHSLADNMTSKTYIGTVLMHRETLVLHAFETTTNDHNS